MIRKSKRLELSAKSMGMIVKEILDSGGHAVLTAKGDSMFPFIKNGDKITITAPKEKTPRTGDIIAFINRVDRRLVVHRIIKISGHFFLAKGDFCYGNDGCQSISDILGYLPESKNRYPLSVIVAYMSRVNILRTITAILKRLNS